MKKKTLSLLAAILLALAAPLFHGTEDPYVPESYSRRAAETLPDAELVIVEGAGHGFRGDDLIRVAEDTAAFVRRVTALPAEDAA